MALGFSHHDSTTRTQDRRCRTRRAARRSSLAALAFLALFSTAPLRAFEEEDDDLVKKWQESETKSSWVLSPALYGGYLDPLDGYPRFESFASGGLDLYVRPPLPQFPNWADKLVGRISFNYFPLEAPKEVRGVMEDIYSIDFSVLYRLTRFQGKPDHLRWVPFLGGGIGVYQDVIKSEHPAFSSLGQIKQRETYMGLNGSAGFMLPCLGPIRLIPEVRYHALKKEHGEWATHISYQLGLAYWIPDRIEE
ncbi:MAG: hypothetical protein IPH91_07335 [Elusimicrobia bacterium]|nr:hypothetical protein [Elusimicrobiota bacterium]